MPFDLVEIILLASVSHSQAWQLFTIEGVGVVGVGWRVVAG